MTAFSFLINYYYFYLMNIITHKVKICLNIFKLITKYAALIYMDNIIRYL